MLLTFRALTQTFQEDLLKLGEIGVKTAEMESELEDTEACHLLHRGPHPWCHVWREGKHRIGQHPLLCAALCVHQAERKRNPAGTGMAS